MPQKAAQTSSGKKSTVRAGAPAAPPSSAPREERAPIPQEAIARRAYEKYAARGYAHGFDQEDWAAAAAELAAEQGERGGAKKH